jgi:hypothetical protein
MADQTAEQAPRVKARIAGIFYLLTIVTSVLALLVSGSLRSTMLLASTGCYVVVTVLFYGLFRPVNRNVSAVAAIFSLLGCTLSTLDLFHPGLFGINPLMFFGCYCLTLGYLIYWSTFMPRILGALMAVGGLGWLTFAWPALSDRLLPYNMAPGVLAESALTLWLLAAGVNAQRWNERARAAA